MCDKRRTRRGTAQPVFGIARFTLREMRLISREMLRQSSRKVSVRSVIHGCVSGHCQRLSSRQQQWLQVGMLEDASATELKNGTRL